MSQRRLAAAVLAAVTIAGIATAGCAGTAPASQAAATHAQPLSAAALAQSLSEHGQPVSGLIVYTTATDPNHLMGRQGGYTSKVAWTDTRAVKAGAGVPASADEKGGIQYGGGIEVFPTAAGAQARYQELKGFTAPFGDGYDYLAGTAVLRLSQYLTPAQARQYESALRQAS